MKERWGQGPSTGTGAPLLSFEAFRGNRPMTPLAGPLLASFLMFDGNAPPGYLLTGAFVLCLALAGLFLALLLEFRAR